MKYLADWAKKLSWLETARSFNTSWRKSIYRTKLALSSQRQTEGHFKILLSVFRCKDCLQRV